MEKLLSILNNHGITTAIAFAGFCLGVYNCILEVVRRHPRAIVKVKKARRDSPVNKCFSAMVVNVGEVAFTVSEVYLVKRNGERIAPASPGGGDNMPKVVHPGEDCEIVCYGIDGEKHPILGNVVRVVFTTSSGKKFKSKKLPRNFEDGAFRPTLPFLFTFHHPRSPRE